MQNRDYIREYLAAMTALIPRLPQKDVDDARDQGGLSG